MKNLEKNYPNLFKVVSHVSKQSIFQKKAISRYLETVDTRFLEFAEDFILRMLKAVGRGENHEYLASAYFQYTKLIRLEEMYFAKEGKYRFSNYDEVYKNVYSRDDYMFDYVVGLGMTQLFWPNHWEIVNFYLSEFIPLVKEAKSGAEVGVGHGLFHSELLRGAPEVATKMLDVSPTSLNMTHRMIEATGLNPERATPVLGDVQKSIPIEENSLDVLLMGELIEHIEYGKEVLGAFAKRMKTSGYCFFTTACNAPAEDHILLFRTVGEVHDILDETGWKVVKENCGTLNNMSVEEAERDGHNINYAAVLMIQ